MADSPSSSSAAAAAAAAQANPPSNISSSKLFQPLKLGNIHLHHRIAMAPLTRYRADTAHIPLLPMVATYYAQRASSLRGTLLISEAIFISPQAGGMDNIPGLWDAAQLSNWRIVTDAVHQQGGYIFAQLWCLGRAASRKVLAREGLDVVSSSAVGIGGNRPVPRAMSDEEVWVMVGAYAVAARNAVEAGFDGVEIHGANGYMVDQFTQDTCNKRTDQWGGSIENRARFALEVATAVAAAVGPERTGIRLSPYSEFQAMRMADPEPQFKYLIDRLSEMKLAYLHLTSPRVNGPIDVKAPVDTISWAVAAWKNVSPVILAGGYRADTAQEEVDRNYPDSDILIAFGRLFISTPDLPYRIQQGLPLSKYDRSTFYTPLSDKGYTDYPFSDQWQHRQSRL